MTVDEFMARSFINDGQSFGQRYAELVFRNGGRSSVQSWGVRAYGGGVYGADGLEQEEAFELTYMSGMLAGYLAGCEPGVRRKNEARIKTWIEDEWKRKGALTQLDT